MSNAFAKREFGKPLVEKFFPSVDLQKVIDCSGLKFPGHGTPTCIVFGHNQKPESKSPIRVAATLPGGGDLRTPPEDSPLWKTLAEHHNQPRYTDSRIIVADRHRSEMAKWPWNLDSRAESTRQAMEASRRRLLDFIEGEVGVCTMTNCDDVFPLSMDQARRLDIPVELLRVFQEGDSIRNWTLDSDWFVLTPYDDRCQPLPEEKLGKALDYLKPYKTFLENRLSFGNKTFKELGRPWFSFERMNANKYANPNFIAFVEIATHGHFTFWNKPRVYKQTTQTVKLPSSRGAEDYYLLTGLLNSSAALFWLKQVCFNKGAGEDEERDRFVYAGGKVQKLSVPELIASALEGERNPLADSFIQLSLECSVRGQTLSSLALRKVFEKAGEAYHDWNTKLPGYVAPHEEIRRPFESAEDLRRNLACAIGLRENLRAEMIARQEEMDWLGYESYGLTSNSNIQLRENDLLLAREHRPFVLWAEAEGHFGRAVELIPADWSSNRKHLWQARLKLIRDNEHIRRIEQPVYKRRWEEQWKVGSRWHCGQVAYDQEFLDTFYSWLSEKAEWWLEKSKSPATLDVWIVALWDERRVQSAWSVAAEAINRIELWKRGQKREADW